MIKRCVCDGSEDVLVVLSRRNTHPPVALPLWQMSSYANESSWWQNVAPVKAKAELVVSHLCWTHLFERLQTGAWKRDLRHHVPASVSAARHRSVCQSKKKKQNISNGFGLSEIKAHWQTYARNLLYILRGFSFPPRMQSASCSRWLQMF